MRLKESYERVLEFDQDQKPLAYCGEHFEGEELIEKLVSGAIDPFKRKLG